MSRTRWNSPPTPPCTWRCRRLYLRKKESTVPHVLVRTYIVRIDDTHTAHHKPVHPHTRTPAHPHTRTPYTRTHRVGSSLTLTLLSLSSFPHRRTVIGDHYGDAAGDPTVRGGVVEGHIPENAHLGRHVVARRERLSCFHATRRGGAAGEREGPGGAVAAVEGDFEGGRRAISVTPERGGKRERERERKGGETGRYEYNPTLLIFLSLSLSLSYLLSYPA